MAIDNNVNINFTAKDQGAGKTANKIAGNLSNVGASADKSSAKIRTLISQVSTGLSRVRVAMLDDNRTFDSYLNTFKSTFATRLAGVWAILRYVNQANQAVANASNSLKAMYRLTGNQRQSNEGLVLAVQIANKYKIAIEDATGAMIDFMRQGRSMEESSYILDKLARLQTLMVSSTGKTVPMTDMVSYYTSLSKQLEYSTTKSLEMMNIISEMDVKTPATFEKITRAIQKFAGTATIANLTMQEVVAVATGLTSRGFTGEEAGTAINTMLSRAFGNDRINALFSKHNINSVKENTEGIMVYKSELEKLLELYTKLKGRNTEEVREFITAAFGTRMGSKGTSALNGIAEAMDQVSQASSMSTQELDQQDRMLKEILSSYSRLRQEIKNTFNTEFITAEALSNVEAFHNALIATISPSLQFAKTLASIFPYLIGFGDSEEGIRRIVFALSALANIKLLQFFKSLNEYLVITFANGVANAANGISMLISKLQGKDITGDTLVKLISSQLQELENIKWGQQFGIDESIFEKPVKNAKKLTELGNHFATSLTKQATLERQITNEQAKQVSLSKKQTTQTITPTLAKEQEAVRQVTAKTAKEAIQYNMTIKATAKDIKHLYTFLTQLQANQDKLGKTFATIYGYTDAILGSIRNQLTATTSMNTALTTQLSLLKQISSAKAASFVENKVSSPKTAEAKTVISTPTINPIPVDPAKTAAVSSLANVLAQVANASAQAEQGQNKVAASMNRVTASATTQAESLQSNYLQLQSRIANLRATFQGLNDKIQQFSEKGIVTPAMTNAKKSLDAVGDAVNNLSNKFGTLQSKNNLTVTNVKNLTKQTALLEKTMHNTSKAVQLVGASINSLGNKIRTASMMFTSFLNKAFAIYSVIALFRMFNSTLKNIKESLTSISKIKLNSVLEGLTMKQVAQDNIRDEIVKSKDTIQAGIKTLKEFFTRNIDTAVTELSTGKELSGLFSGLSISPSDIAEAKTFISNFMNMIATEIQKAIDNGESSIDIYSMLRGSTPATDNKAAQEIYARIKNALLQSKLLEDTVKVINNNLSNTYSKLNDFNAAQKTSLDELSNVVETELNVLTTKTLPQLESALQDSINKHNLLRDTTLFPDSASRAHNKEIEKDIAILDTIRSKVITFNKELKTGNIDKAISNMANYLVQIDTFAKSKSLDAGVFKKYASELREQIERIQQIYEEQKNIQNTKIDLKIDNEGLILDDIEDFKKQVDTNLSNIRTYWETKIQKTITEISQSDPYVLEVPLAFPEVSDLEIQKLEAILKTLRSAYNVIDSSDLYTNKDATLSTIFSDIIKIESELAHLTNNINKAKDRETLKNAEELLKLWKDTLKEKEQLLEIQYRENNKSLEGIAYKQDQLKIYKEQYTQLKLLTVTSDKQNEKAKNLKDTLLRILQLEKEITDTVKERKEAELDRKVDQLQFELQNQGDYLAQTSRVNKFKNVIQLVEEKLKNINEEIAKMGTDANIELLNEAQQLNQELITLKQNLSDIQYRYQNMDLSMNLSMEIDEMVNKIKVDLSTGLLKGTQGMESIMQALTGHVDGIYSKIQEVINNQNLSNTEKDNQIQTLTTAANELTSQLSSVINNMSVDANNMTPLTATDLTNLTSPWSSAIEAVKAELDNLRGKNDEVSLKYKEVLQEKLQAYQNADQAFLEKMREQQEAFLEELKSNWDEGFDIGYEYGFTEEGMKQLKKQLARKIAKRVSNAIRDSLMEAFNKIDTSGIQKSMTGLFGNTFGTMFTNMIFGIFSTILGFLIDDLFNDLFSSMEEAQREQQQDQINNSGYDWSYKTPHETKAYNQYAPNITQESVKIIKFMNSFTITVDAANAMIAQRSAMEKVANEIVEKSNRAIAKQIGVRI